MKKFLSVVLTLMMVFSVFTTASAATVKHYVDSVFVGKNSGTDPFFEFNNMPISIKATKNGTEYPGSISELLVSGGVDVDFAATLDMKQLRDFFVGSDFIGIVLAGDSDAKSEFERATVTTDIDVTINHPGVTVTGADLAGSLTDDNGLFYEKISEREVNTDQIVVHFTQQRAITVTELLGSLSNPNGYLSDLTFELPGAAKYEAVGTYPLSVTMDATTTVAFDGQGITGEAVSLKVKYDGAGSFQATIYTSSPGGGGTTKYALTYETDGGSAIDKETYAKNATVKLTKVPKKEGYIFEGWYLDKELTQKVTEVKMTKNTTVYAGWVEDNGLAGNGYDTPESLNGDNHFAYIVGYPDETVKPNNNITRAEVTTIFFRLLKENERNMNLVHENNFSDVDILDWYNTAVSTMAKLGIVNGRNSETFDPNAFITRAEFAAICARFVEAEVSNVNKFTDVAGHWAEKEIYEAAEYGWIRGYEDNTFKPNQFITRAEAMTMINRVLNRIPENTNDLLDNMKKWSDNSDEAAWYYIPVQEATNSHDYDKKNHVYEKWTSLSENIDWTKFE
ncbi:MAG: S-layer homology domain-containing protein [Clostridia bacterium]|nr:S-layer homology domain-containing protein [Clostridia bacterium]